VLPFFEFTIEVGSEGNSTWLSLAGEEGSRTSSAMSCARRRQG